MGRTMRKDHAKKATATMESQHPLPARSSAVQPTISTFFTTKRSEKKLVVLSKWRSLDGDKGKDLPQKSLEDGVSCTRPLATGLGLVMTAKGFCSSGYRIGCILRL
jgi:hypothetical protein